MLRGVGDREEFLGPILVGAGCLSEDLGDSIGRVPPSGVIPGVNLSA
jgi:hypothetical protein